MTSQTYLVTGANGHLGRRVVELLFEQGVGRVIATSREASKIADLTGKVAEVRAADFDKPDTLAAAFAGADRLLLISTDAIYVPGQRLAQHKAAIEAAAKSGVKHIVYTSMNAPRPGGSLIEDDHFWTEQAIMQSGMSWTILRVGMYADNLLLTLPRALESGTWANATENGPCSWVTRNDVATVCAAFLASAETALRIYDVTGPEVVRTEEVASIASKVTGKPLRYVPITVDTLRDGMAAMGLPPTLIGSMISMDVAMARGYYATVTPVVAEAKGAKPTTLEEFLTAHKVALLASSY